MATLHSNKHALIARDLGPVRQLFGSGLKVLLFATLSYFLFHVVSIYGDALRDARYLDGWVLVCAISLQFYFHITATRKILPPKAALRWRKLHIFVGHLLIPIFLLHSDFSMPDTGLEWVMWVCFVLVAASGVFGVILTWLLRSRFAINDTMGLDRIPARRSKLVRDVHAIVASPHPATAWKGLPPPPYDAWIGELYAVWLKEFFDKQPSFADRLFGSHRRLKRVMAEINLLSGYLDGPGRSKLAAIGKLVVEKDRLDAACVALDLSRGWLLVHVPASYMMVVLTLFHVLVVYSFSSGAW